MIAIMMIEKFRKETLVSLTDINDIDIQMSVTILYNRERRHLAKYHKLSEDSPARIFCVVLGTYL